MDMKTDHPQVHIRYGEYEADVDEQLAPLLYDVWRLGLQTDLSCQDNVGGMVWIEFATVQDGELFLDAILRYDPDCESLYGRARHAWSPPVGWRRYNARCWKYEVHLRDWSILEVWHNGECINELPEEERPCFSFSLAVRFPRSDLAEVTERTHQAAEHAAMISAQRLDKRR